MQNYITFSNLCANYRYKPLNLLLLFFLTSKLSAILSHEILNQPYLYNVGPFVIKQEFKSLENFFDNGKKFKDKKL